MENKLKSGWTSKDKENFIVGEKYWCFYMETTSKGNKLRRVSGVNLYRCTSVKIKKTSKIYTGDVKFELISGQGIYNASLYMNGYGSAICHFFNTEEDAKNGFDEQIMKLAKGLRVSEKTEMYSKMYGLPPDAPKIEIDSMNFYNKLTKTEQKFVKWIKKYGNI